AGVALARLWQKAGHRIAGLVGGSPASLPAARAVLGADVASISHREALGAGTLVVIAVPDDRVDGAVADLALGRPSRPETLALHLGGARGADALVALARAGAKTAAFHPLRSFPTRDPGAHDLGGALCAIEAAPPDEPRLFALARDIGGSPFALAAK